MNDRIEIGSSCNSLHHDKWLHAPPTFTSRRHDFCSCGGFKLELQIGHFLIGFFFFFFALSLIPFLHHHHFLHSAKSCNVVPGPVAVSPSRSRPPTNVTSPKGSLTFFFFCSSRNFHTLTLSTLISSRTHLYTLLNIVLHTTHRPPRSELPSYRISLPTALDIKRYYEI